MRVLVFGDSIANGFYDSRGGWVDRLKQYYLAKVSTEQNLDPPNVFNLGISADFTQSVLDRFVNETKARGLPGEELAFIFAIGTNDTLYRDDEFESSTEAYRNQLSTLLKQAKEFSQKVLFVSLFPVVDKLLQPLPWSSSGKCYSTERMKMFNDVLVDFCNENNLPLVDLWTPFEESSDLESLFIDGIHPNDEGHKLIFNTVKPKLEEILQ